MSLPIILASASKTRLDLLERIGIKPDHIITSGVEEIERKGEKAPQFAVRMSVEKANAVASQFEQGIIIAADTVPVCSGRMLRKAENADDVKQCLELLSGKRHRIYTAVTVIKKSNDKINISSKLVTSILKFKRLTTKEIEFFCSTQEGVGKAGGYSLQGYAESFVSHISGSFSNVLGLPLYETNLLIGSNKPGIGNQP
jgi:septum formation protein